MKIGGMKAAINGQCIDIDILLAAMTCAEKEALIAKAQGSIENWKRLERLNREGQI